MLLRLIEPTAGKVSVNGAEQPAIRVRFNPIALASMGLLLVVIVLAFRQPRFADLGPLAGKSGRSQPILRS